MGKLTIVAILLSSMIIAMPMIQGTFSEDPNELEHWFKMVGRRKQIFTKLHFYFHALPEGNIKPNQAQVAQPVNKSAFDNGNSFGTVNIVDYPLTEGPELNSKLVGRAEGFYALVSSIGQFTLFTSFNLIFPDGSTITTSGHNPAAVKIREMPITGGSGAFRLAQGLVTIKTLYYEPVSGNATVELYVLALHY